MHMSYTLPLPCGCTAYVSCWPETGIAHTRIIELRSPDCQVRTHERGAKVYLWELLPKGSGMGDQGSGIGPPESAAARIHRTGARSSEPAEADWREADNR